MHLTTYVFSTIILFITDWKFWFKGNKQWRERVKMYLHLFFLLHSVKFIKD
jgi:hypothetical protein